MNRNRNRHSGYVNAFKRDCLKHGKIIKVAGTTYKRVASKNKHLSYTYVKLL